ncbi:MAG: hypothetical protein IT473_11995 [Lysobacter sp.]|nr:hypothetical protein [Lysobacter sp.]
MLCAGVLAAGFAHAASQTPAEAIQPLGVFHRGEAVARDGQTWMTLWVNESAGTARLVRSRVRVAQVEDPIVDDTSEGNTGEDTGEEVSVPVSAAGGDTPLMLLRSGRVRSGPVRVATIEDRGADGLPGYTFRLNGGESRLDTQCEPRPAPASDDNRDVQHAVCRLILSIGGTRQTLLEMEATRSAGGALGSWTLGHDAAPRVLFAGDLDRDGGLDLIFDTSDHYNLMLPTLFLSSAAGAGQLLRRVSEHRAVGC